MTERVYNFSPGPAVLPLAVLKEIQRDMLALPGAGASVLEISHRCESFDKILAEAQANLRQLLNIPQNYQVLFMQGGSLLQFTALAMNFLQGAGVPADYVVTGSWGKKARDEAKPFGPVNTVWDGSASKYDRLPAASELQFSPQAAYIHFTSNETIQGVQFPADPPFPATAGGGAPLICDMSSDFLSRPVPIERYGMIYACAQKNAGPAGVTVVIARDDLLARCPQTVPGILNYQTIAENDSRYNTPPTFGIYVVMLVTRWLLHEIGGLENMARLNAEKAGWLYKVLDEEEGFYQGHAQRDCRSPMNVTFRLPDADTEKAFLKEAEAHNLSQLKGHRSVGGIRASIYNAMPREGVEALASFMRAFRAQRLQTASK
jgi:phosphoserine aminotransferase